MKAALGESSRVEWADTLKGGLIFCVVLGHVLLPIHSDDASLSTTFSLIYLFHMPLFVFVSGVFSKHTVDGSGRLRVERILSYVCLGLLFNVLLRAMSGAGISLVKLVTFPSAPWYLISLATWMLLTPFFLRLKPAGGIALAVVVSLCSSVLKSQTDVFALSRTAHFLPYFVCGYYLDIETLGRLRTPRMRAVIGILGVGTALWYVLWGNCLDPFMFFIYGNNSCRLALSLALPGLLAVSLVGIALCLGCIALAPNRCSVLSFLGKRTLQVYVVHRLVRELMVRLGFYDALSEWVSGPSMLLVLLVISLAICVFSLLPIFSRVLNSVTSSRWSFLLREG